MYNSKNRAFLLKNHLKSVLGATQLHSIDVHGKNWQWLEAGDNNAVETVVILHGLSMSKNHWRTTLTLLSDHYRVIVPDIPGFKSAFPAQDPSAGFEGIAKELAAFLAIIVGRPTHLVGHSMAATLALGLAMRMVVPVKSIALVSMADMNVTEGLSLQMQFRRMSEFIQQTTQAQYIAYIKAMFYAPPAAIEMIAKSNWQNLEANRAQIAELFLAMEAEFSFVQRFSGALDIPMLILNGKQDLWYDLTEQSRYFQSDLVTRVEIDHCRHLPFIEQPVEFCQALKQFIQGVSNHQDQAEQALAD